MKYTKYTIYHDGKIVKKEERPILSSSVRVHLCFYTIVGLLALVFAIICC